MTFDLLASAQISSDGSAVQSTTGAPGTATPTGAKPQGQTSPYGSLVTFLPLILIFLVMMFVMNNSKRKQDKERKALLGAVKKTDKVRMVGGEFGSIVEVRDDRVLVKIDESSNTKVWYARESVAAIVSE